MPHPLLCLLCCLSSLLAAQPRSSRVADKLVFGDSSQLHLLILDNYSELLGTAYAFDDDSLRFQLYGAATPTNFPAGAVRYLGVYVPPRRVGRLRRDAPPVPLTDLTLIRTALPYQGERRFKTVMLLYNSIEWDIDRHFQLGGGLAGPLGVLFTQRYRTSLRDWLHLGVSNELIYAALVENAAGNAPLVGDATTLVTIGSDRQFFNFGAGTFYASDSPVIPNYRLGFGTALGRPTHFYVEALAYVDGRIVGVLPSFNVSLARRRHRWTFGLTTELRDGQQFGPAPIPYLSYSLYN